MTSKIRIVIVDDHDVVREGLRAILRQDPLIEIVGEAVDGEEACDQAARLQPDIVLMDLSMPNVNGRDATRRISTLEPRPKILILSAHRESTYVRDTLRAGASGYVLKGRLLRDLLKAVHTVHEGGTFLDSELVGQPSGAVPAQPLTLAADLSAREIDVASLTARGYTNMEIAASLLISVKTVETHKARLMAKLGLGTRAELVRYAIYRGWLTP
jgi:DNA-binding NarL/FixJ family response regulator